ncbi:MAG: peroxidase family protein, partial [Waterburya sp.]
LNNLMNPNPRVISQKLLARQEFQPVKIMNLWAASWIQFQTHDWFAHKPGNIDDSHEIPLEASDPWPEPPMLVPRTPPEPQQEGQPPTYANLNTHWWDGSQVYGSDEQSARKLRTGTDGKMKLGDEALLPLDVEGVELVGFADNWWVGLSMLHVLFVMEHNAICDRLRQTYSDWSDEQLFHKARLINSALMAKIHTVEWTPAILPHPITAAALRINWAGIVGEDLQELFKFLDESEILGGIVGSDTNHDGVPYSLTEEFTAVYRMHPLMPDDFPMYSLKTGATIGNHNLLEVSRENTREIMEKYELPDLFYSFGVSHPGALRLHNYPKHLQLITRDDGTTIDLAAVDVLRDRERGIPRYNEFRELLRMERIKTFEELTDNPEWARELKEVYNNDIDQVDLMVGMFAEPLIEGFGFAETAFRIFILMASRRLKSDRFFTTSFNEEVYTKIGLDWIKENSMLSILLRHFPMLEPSLRGLDNAFQPWNQTSE